MLTRTDGQRVMCHGTWTGTACDSSGFQGYNRRNQVKKKTYSDGTAPAFADRTPSVTFIYDSCANGAGRLCSVSNSVSATSYAYDSLGRVATSTQTTGGGPRNFSYSYKLNDGLAGIVYPTGRSVSYGFSSAGRTKEVTGVRAGMTTNYTSATTAIGYAAHGALASVTLGNQLSEVWTFDSRLRAASMAASAPGAPRLSLGYVYHANGNVQTQTITRGAQSWTQGYTYDGVNRLKSATESGAGSWKQSFGYDRYGNRWVDTTPANTFGLTSESLETPVGSDTASAWYSSGNNRINGWGYDGAGNVTQVGGMTRSFAYDGENRQKLATVNGVQSTYEYDGAGRRVRARTASGTTEFVYDAMGRLAAEYGTAAENGLRYVTADALGSTRLVTEGVAGAAVVGEFDYLPFGEELKSGTGGRGATFGGAATRVKFTGKERDAETGLDYFGARYMSSAQGRFTSADPGNAGATRENPQSWNMYTYVVNNPLKLVDSNGKWPTYIHNKIINDALPGLSKQQQQILKTASHDMDYVVRMNNRDPQDPANSYLHGMSDGTVNQDREQARKDADTFIGDQEKIAQNQQAEYEKAGGKGLSPDALRTFGLALHTVTDRTSPAHQGEQPWNGTEGAANQAAAADHVRRELVMGNNAGAQAVGAARGFFQRVFGAAATKQATTPPPPPPPRRPLDDK